MPDRSSDRPRSRSRLPPVENSNPLLLKDIYDGFEIYISSAQVQVQKVEIERVVAAGFPPKTLSGRLSSTIEDHIQEQRDNFKFIVAILLYTYLSQLMILINIVITNNIAKDITDPEDSHTDSAGYEIEAQKKICFEIPKTLDTLISKANKLSEVVPLFEDNDETFLQNIQQLNDFHPNYSALPVDLIEQMITRVKSTLTIKNINPSMDTIEYAISCLNFDIFYCCLTDSTEYKDFYKKLQGEHLGSQIINIPTLHRGIGSKSTRLGDSEHKHSFFLYFYENIHNIAYNVFYNHKYWLPTVCQEFGEMVKHLETETGIQVNVQERISGQVKPVQNTWLEDSPLLTSSSDSSMPDNDSSEGSTTPIPFNKRQRLDVKGTRLDVKVVGYGGGSSRTRRPRQKRTQKQKKRTRRRHNKRSGK